MIDGLNVLTSGEAHKNGRIAIYIYSKETSFPAQGHEKVLLSLSNLW